MTQLNYETHNKRTRSNSGKDEIRKIVNVKLNALRKQNLFDKEPWGELVGRLVLKEAAEGYKNNKNDILSKEGWSLVQSTFTSKNDIDAYNNYINFYNYFRRMTDLHTSNNLKVENFIYKLIWLVGEQVGKLSGIWDLFYKSKNIQGMDDILAKELIQTYESNYKKREYIQQLVEKVKFYFKEFSTLRILLNVLIERSKVSELSVFIYDKDEESIESSIELYALYSKTYKDLIEKTPELIEQYSLDIPELNLEIVPSHIKKDNISRVKKKIRDLSIFSKDPNINLKEILDEKSDT